MWNNVLPHIVKYLTTFDVKWNKSPHAPQRISHAKRISRTKCISQIPQGIYFTEKSHPLTRMAFFLAGAEGLEPTTHGFGDRYSTNWAIPLFLCRIPCDRYIISQTFQNFNTFFKNIFQIWFFLGFCAIFRFVWVLWVQNLLIFAFLFDIMVL